MCLSTTLKNPLKAKEEIAVYKVLDQYGVPPFYEDYTYNYGFNKAMGPKHVEKDPDVPSRRDVHGGFLHAYTSEVRAMHHATGLNNGCPYTYTSYDRRFRVVKMYVPVGVKYYADSFWDEICAEKLLWKEEKEEE